MRTAIEPCSPSGKIRIPSSKSYAHRALICACLSDGESIVGGIDENSDVLATADVLNALGAQVRFEGKTAYVKGCGKNIIGGGELLCRESGSTLRFMIPVSLLGGGGIFKGSERLVSRGVGVYNDIFSGRGITIVSSKDSIDVCGRLRAGDYVIAGNVSSQFITGMMLALPLCDGDSSIRVTPPFESRAYVDMTIDTMAKSGVGIIKTSPNTFEIKGNQKYSPINTTVEGDWSNAAFFFALSALGHDVEPYGLNRDSVQGDKICVEYLDRLNESNAVLDVSGCPDLAPILFTVASAKCGAVFTGTHRLAIKESDRAAVMAEELAKFGAELVVGSDSVEVKKRELHAPHELLCGHNDHRVVMSLAVLATKFGGVIDGAEAVSKSFPEFFNALDSLGAEVKYINE